MGMPVSIREQGLGGRYFMKAPCERYFFEPSACALEKLLAQDLHIPLFKLPKQRTTLSLKWAVICSLQGTGDRWWNSSCYSTCVQRRQHSQREGRREPLKQGSGTEYVPTSLVVKHGTRGIRHCWWRDDRPLFSSVMAPVATESLQCSLKAVPLQAVLTLSVLGLGPFLP